MQPENSCCYKAALRYMSEAIACAIKVHDHACTKGQ